ncbi:CarD family transcriptional regulator [Oscillibacter sp. GMB15532]|uniref:CarD family transcriptional regulator n=1 Tax=Oscillibacter sp. GMB15532 TaxID=3230022 RepID=UPI0034DF26D1
MFSVGDMVVHPMHGAGVIDGIVCEKLGGAAQDYYVFKMLVGGLLLKIPTANSDAIGLRPVSDRAEVEALFSALPTMNIDESTNWNKRYRENLQRLKSGDLYELARVIKSLTMRDRERSLSTGERKMLHNAKQILISEIVLTGVGSYEQVEQRLDGSMEV